MKRTYRLEASSVEPILADIENQLNEWKAPHRDVLRIRLTLEELLLRLLRFEERPEAISLYTGRRFGQKIVNLQYDGQPLDPTQSDDEDDWSTRILNHLGLSPFWSYRGRKNRVGLSLPRTSERGMLFKLLIALVSAIILGALGMLLPEAFRTAANELVIEPVLNMFLGLLNTFAGVMIAFTIISGILGVGDASALNRLGKYVLLRFIATAFIVSAVTLAFIFPFLRVRFSYAVESGSSQAGQVVQMLFGILPKNLIEPFLNANTMQIIVLAIFVGGALLVVQEKAPRLCALADEGARLTQTIMSFVCSLIPLFIFVSMLRQIWTGNARSLFSLWKPLCLYMAALLIVTIVLLLATSWRVGMPPLQLLRVLSPPFMIALTTASSMSAYSQSVDTCKQKLGIDGSLVDFAFPIGVVLYMPGGVITFAVLAGYLAEIYRVEIDFSWLLMAWLLCAVLSLAVPPIPGAMLTCYGILMAQLGIPAEGLLLAAAFDVVQDFTSSGFDILLLQLELTRQAVPLGKKRSPI